MQQYWWYCDFEGYQLGSEKYVVKEILILFGDGSQCFTYLICLPAKHLFKTYNNSTCMYQFSRHRIPWTAGKHYFSHVMEDIQKKINRKSVYVKDLEKARFLQDNNINAIDLDMLPSIQKLNACHNECCDYGHGSFCARRKVCELKHYIDMNKKIISFS